MQINIRELARIFVISVIALAGDLGLFILLTGFFHLSYLVSAALSFLVGLAINYQLSIRWGFSKRSQHDPKRELLLFCLIGITGAGINELLLWSFTGVLGLHLVYSKAISVGTVFWWNYGLRKIMLFS